MAAQDVRWAVSSNATALGGGVKIPNPEEPFAILLRVNMSSTAWKSYEEVARYLLNQFAKHFNIGRVEGEQKIQGKSGVCWRIDAKGILDNGESFVVIECRRHTTRRIPQGYVGQVAYSI